MPTFDPRADWFSRHIPVWERVLPPFVGKPGLRALEVGCFEGRATLWLLEHVLTDATSTITVIDTFAGSPEHEVMLPDYDWDGLRGRFCCNLLDAGYGYDEWCWGDWRARHQTPARVRICGDTSWEALYFLLLDDNENKSTEAESFDLIYLDGSHRAADTLTDAVLAWRLLKPGGLLIFDDLDFRYELPSGEVLEPGIGIRAFASAFREQVERMQSSGAQLFAWKQGS